MTSGFGWLAKRPDLPRTPEGIAGVPLDPELPTRWEEFTWVREQVRQIAHLQPLDILDAGTGTAPGIHILPEILAADGHHVIAVDQDATTLKMPASPSILRIVDDMRRFANLRRVTVDVYVSVSVVEHLTTMEWPEVFREAFRVLRPGGHLLVTADEVNPTELASEAAGVGFQVGGPTPFDGQHLTPRVVWLIAHKPD